MSAIGSKTLWSQELEVHWPQSWRSVTGRDVLLEVFEPQIFNVTNDAIFIRYGENQDLRVSQYGMHLRILALEPMDDRITEVLDKVLHIVEPAKLHSLEASFSHVRPIDMEYDDARTTLAQVFYSPWVQQRPMKDFALHWDERGLPKELATFELGVVNEHELIVRVARASSMSESVLDRQTPAWMKVRMPRVAIFMSSDYSLHQEITPDLGRVQVTQTWRQWRERSDLLFSSLTDLAISAQEEELS